MNYIGSKLSLLNFLQDTIYKVTPYKKGDCFEFADLFAGTGIVGATFKKNGCRVTSNDLQYYSYVLSKHYIENSPSLDGTLLDHLNGLPWVEGFIYQNYCAGSGSGRNYFTDENGKKCDSIRQELQRLYEGEEITTEEYFYYLASLINSIDKYANTASVYGAFLKHIKKSALKTFSLELLPVIEGNCQGTVYNENINDVVEKVKGDVLYLDPPYNARQYCSNYHLLETIARYDTPQIRGKTGLREDKAQKSAFCSKRTVETAFDELIAKAKYRYIFLSYNNEGLMDLDTIKTIMARYGTYHVETTQYRRFKADREENRKHKATGTVEYLHCLEKEEP